MNGHRPRSTAWPTALLLALCFTLVAVPLFGADFDRADREQRQILLRSDAAEAVAQRHDLDILESYDTADGRLYLVAVGHGKKAADQLDELAADPDVAVAGPVTLASLPALTLSSTATGDELADIDLVGEVSSPCLDWIDPQGVWRGYAEQQATGLTRLYEGQELDGYTCGEGLTVAVIDTAIDIAHPLLASALVPGVDFTADLAGLDAVATSELGTRTRAIVEGADATVVAGDGYLSPLESAAVIMGTTDAEVLDDLASKGPYYGHGTMVAGLVRLTAPAAAIMPLVAFDDQGIGHPLDIVRAIDHAVAHGADVINMSFSLEVATPELYDAIERARQAGVMTVAAAGNHGESGSIYPAAFDATIGVAASDADDHLTSFSNFGLVTADLAAPGSGVVTLYPGGLYATGWGTSFSTPMVAGNLALIRAYAAGDNRGAHKKTRTNLLLGTEFLDHLWDDILSSGRLDTFGAVAEARY